MKSILLKLLPHAVAVVIFIILSQLFFSLENSDNGLRQADSEHVMGMSKELGNYRMMNDGKEPLWANNMFGGMPGFQTNISYPSNLIRKVDVILKLNQGPATGTLFMCMLGFYIFCLCVRINPWLGIAAGIAFGLSSINILYLGAGHTSKVNAIAYMAPTLGGLLLAFRGKWALGASVFALCIGLHIAANHLQMTYYLMFLLGLVALAEVIKGMVEKKMKSTLITCAALLVALALGLAPNIGNLLTTKEYSNLTTRGKTDLTISASETEEKKVQEGLAPDYMMQYNMAGREWMAVFLPNLKGGSSAYIKSDKKMLQTVPSKLREQVGDMNHYWGEQDASGGAFYFGAFMIFIFVVALIFSKDNLKWPFIVLSILVIALSAKEISGLNKFFIFEFPFYNKFRDHKMMLVLLQVMVPALSIIFIDGLLKSELSKSMRKYMLIGTGCVLLIGVIICVTPTAGGQLLSSGDITMFDQYQDQYKDNSNALMQIDDMKEALVEVRSDIYKADGQRSLLLFLFAAIVIVTLLLRKAKWYVIAPILVIVVAADMWTVSTRYMNEDKREGQYLHYSKLGEKLFPFTPDKCDNAILEKEKINVPDFDSKAAELEEKYLAAPGYNGIKDKTKHKMAAQFGTLSLNTNYRVLLASRGVFAEASIPYFHKSVGGYHAAKLKRYQEMIDFYISDELQAFTDALQTRNPMALDSTLANSKVLNMLNTKYIKYSPDAPPIENKNRLGNAWFVKDIQFVNTADDEIKNIATLDARNAAIVHHEFSTVAKSANSLDSNATATMAEYGTNYFKYTTTSSSEAPLIFSEVYYPAGWICRIDNNEVPAFRANYFLRGVMVPAGDHIVEWSFEPASYKNGVVINWIGSFSLLGIVLLVFGFNIKKSCTLLNKSEA